MKSDGAGSRASGKAAAGLASPHIQGGFKVISESRGESGPDQSNVVDMVRGAVGSALEGIAEAKEQVKAAKRLHEIARSVGDTEVEEMMARELTSLGAATRIGQ